MSLLPLFPTDVASLDLTEPMHFDGETFDPTRDGARLTRLLDRVQLIIQDGQWHTLDEIVAACGGTTASVSARLRDLRKVRFGGHTIERRYLDGGLWQYRMAKESEVPTRG
jgi:hypothetical protein